MDNYFVHNLLVFARLLRWLGIPASAEQVSDLGRILRATGIAQREDVYYSARAIFVRRREDRLPLTARSSSFSACKENLNSR